MPPSSSFLRQAQQGFARYRRPIDLIIRALLALTFAFATGQYFKNGMARLETSDMSNAAIVTSAISLFAIGLYTFMIACLYIIRLSPKNKFAGLWPTIAALLGGFLMSGLLFFKPRVDLDGSLQIASSMLVLIGNVFAAYVLFNLGRSFSILPESRKLVTSGPYKIVRHPLYLAEAIATLGVLINFFSPGALLLVIVQLVLQLVRIHYEERVLRENFPDYTQYAKRTKRLIPGIY